MYAYYLICTYHSIITRLLLLYFNFHFSRVSRPDRRRRCRQRRCISAVRDVGDRCAVRGRRNGGICAAGGGHMQVGRHEYQSDLCDAVHGRDTCARLSQQPLHGVRQWHRARFAQLKSAGEAGTVRLLRHFGERRRQQ